jgi:hypothetical protein
MLSVVLTTVYPGARIKAHLGPAARLVSSIPLNAPSYSTITVGGQTRYWNTTTNDHRSYQGKNKKSHLKKSKKSSKYMNKNDDIDKNDVNDNDQFGKINKNKNDVKEYNDDFIQNEKKKNDEVEVGSGDREECMFSKEENEADNEKHNPFFVYDDSFLFSVSNELGGGGGGGSGGSSREDINTDPQDFLVFLSFYTWHPDLLRSPGEEPDLKTNTEIGETMRFMGKLIES